LHNKRNFQINYCNERTFTLFRVIKKENDVNYYLYGIAQKMFFDGEIYNFKYLQENFIDHVARWLIVSTMNMHAHEQFVREIPFKPSSM